MASPLPKYEAEVLKNYAESIGGQRVLAREFGVKRVTMARWLNQITNCPPKDQLVAMARSLVMDHPEFAPAEDDTVRYYKKLHGCTTQQAKIIASVLSP